MKQLPDNLRHILRSAIKKGNKALVMHIFGFFYVCPFKIIMPSKILVLTQSKPGNKHDNIFLFGVWIIWVEEIWTICYILYGFLDDNITITFKMHWPKKKQRNKWRKSKKIRNSEYNMACRVENIASNWSISYEFGTFLIFCWMFILWAMFLLSPTSAKVVTNKSGPKHNCHHVSILNPIYLKIRKK